MSKLGKVELEIAKKEKDMLPLFEIDPEWAELWIDMPEYIQGEAEPCQKIIMNFLKPEDVEEFAELTGLNITNRTRSLWFPKMVREPPLNFRYVDTETEEQ